VTSMGRATFTPFVMNFSFRASAAFDLGPGGTVTILGPRSAFVARVAIVSSRPSSVGSARSQGRDLGIIGFRFPAKNPKTLPRYSVRINSLGSPAAGDPETDDPDDPAQEGEATKPHD